MNSKLVSSLYIKKIFYLHMSILSELLSFKAFMALITVMKYNTFFYYLKSCHTQLLVGLLFFLISAL